MFNKSKKSRMLNSASSLDLTPSTRKNSLGLVSLEPRILLDAAGFVTGAEVAMDALVSDDAQLGVQAVFEGEDVRTQETMAVAAQNEELLVSLSETQSEDPTAAPRDLPWLNTLDGETEGEDPTAAPRDLPWLNTLEGETEAEDPTAAPRDLPWLKASLTDAEDPTAAPRDLPWLNTLDGETEGEDPTASPRDLPWLNTLEGETEDEDPTAAPRDLPWLNTLDGTSDETTTVLEVPWVILDQFPGV